MPITNTLDDLNLTSIQRHAVLLVGGGTTISEDDFRIAERKRARYSNGVAKNTSYWKGVCRYCSEDKDINVVVIIRLKTFKALERKGLMILDEGSTSMDGIARFVTARLTPLGWSIFDILAQEYQEAHDSWSKKLELLTKEEAEKGETYKFRTILQRKVKVVRFKKALAEVSVVAKSREEAEKLAEKELAKLDKNSLHWSTDLNPHGVWGDLTSEDYEVEVLLEKESSESVGVLFAGTPSRRAHEKLVKECKNPELIAGVTEYVKYGERSPELRKVLIEEFGGRVLDTGLCSDPSVEVEEQTGIDYDRFSHIMDD